MAIVSKEKACWLTKKKIRVITAMPKPTDAAAVERLNGVVNNLSRVLHNLTIMMIIIFILASLIQTLSGNIKDKFNIKQSNSRCVYMGITKEN